VTTGGGKTEDEMTKVDHQAKWLMRSNVQVRHPKWPNPLMPQ